MCERPPAAASRRPSPFVRGTLHSPPYEGGEPRCEARGRGSLTRRLSFWLRLGRAVSLWFLSPIEFEQPLGATRFFVSKISASSRVNV